MLSRQVRQKVRTKIWLSYTSNLIRLAVVQSLSYFWLAMRMRPLCPSCFLASFCRIAYGFAAKMIWHRISSAVVSAHEDQGLYQTTDLRSLPAGPAISVTPELSGGRCKGLTTGPESTGLRPAPLAYGRGCRGQDCEHYLELAP